MPALSGKIHLPEVQEFFRTHAGKDAASLALSIKPLAGITPAELTRQLASRNKAARKLPEWSACENVVFPDPEFLQQSSSELTARFKATLLSGTHLVDLTGGTGVDTFYMSASFNRTTYVESSADLAELASHNFKALHHSEIHVVHSTAEHFLEDGLANCSFFLDPSRRNNDRRRVFLFEDCSPDIRTLIPRLPSSTHEVLLKASPMIDLSRAVLEIPLPVTAIYVVAVRNECKEVLFLCNPHGHPEGMVHTIDLFHAQSFSFDREEELSSRPETGVISDYLYEPNAAILKSGGVNSLCMAFDLKKLHPNTHLYTADRLEATFPGRIFKIKQVARYRPGKLSTLIRGRRADITTRNFPDSVAVIRKKSGIMPGGDYTIFGYRNVSGDPEICVGTRINPETDK